MPTTGKGRLGGRRSWSSDGEVGSRLVSGSSGADCGGLLRLCGAFLRGMASPPDEWISAGSSLSRVRGAAVLSFEVTAGYGRPQVRDEDASPCSNESAAPLVEKNQGL